VVADLNSITENNAERRRIAVSILLIYSNGVVHLLDQRFSSVLCIRICSMWKCAYISSEAELQN